MHETNNGVLKKVKLTAQWSISVCTAAIINKKRE